MGQQNGESISALIWGTGSLAIMRFNRDQEEQADHAALRTVFERYGSTEGAFEFFDYLLEAEQGEVPAFLSTHPNTRDRLATLQGIALRNHWQPLLAVPIKPKLLPNFD